jgi:hypothetical protein
MHKSYHRQTHTAAFKATTHVSLATNLRLSTNCGPTTTLGTFKDACSYGKRRKSFHTLHTTIFIVIIYFTSASQRGVPAAVHVTYISIPDSSPLASRRWHLGQLDMYVSLIQE